MNPIQNVMWQLFRIVGFGIVVLFFAVAIQELWRLAFRRRLTRVQSGSIAGVIVGSVYLSYWLAQVIR